MNKRFLLLLTLIICMMISTCSFAFSDIEGHWAEEVIDKSSEYGIVNGYQDGTFRPDAYVTRAEFITVLDKMLGLESETDKYIPDITSQDWYYSNVKKALYFGIVQGDQNGNINADSNVTREEAIVMLARALKMQIDDGNYYSAYTDDQDISNWARKELMAFVRKQYIQGYEDNTIRPQNAITRAEMLTMMNRVIKQVSENTMQQQKMNSNLLIKNKNTILNSVEVYGDLIIGESAASTVKFTNVIVTGNLVLYAPTQFDEKTISIRGNVIRAYESKAVSNLRYINEEYGISFSVPDGASTYTGMPEKREDLAKQDLIVVEIEKSDDNYTKTITDISKETIKKLAYDSIFRLNTSGEIQHYPYELYDDNTASHLLVIKRDNIVYTVLFMNVVSNHLMDSVISNLQFVSGAQVTNHDTVVYKNAKLSLKFNYKNGYVGVDDSYNTTQVYEGDSIFKLFIQVNMITDMDKYTLDEIQSLLKTFVMNDGKIVGEEIKSINNHDAIQFEIESEDSKIVSLYVIIGNNLYNFIFKGESTAVNAIGKDMFTEIVNSMEF